MPFDLSLYYNSTARLSEKTILVNWTDFYLGSSKQCLVI